jgi:hypothetical protein
MSKELLKLLEFMRDHSWKDRMTLDEAWFYPSIFLLITNQFSLIEKLKLHKGRVISADDVDSRLKPTGISRE